MMTKKRQRFCHLLLLGVVPVLSLCLAVLPQSFASSGSEGEGVAQFNQHGLIVASIRIATTSSTRQDHGGDPSSSTKLPLWKVAIEEAPSALNAPSHLPIIHIEKKLSYLKWMPFQQHNDDNDEQQWWIGESDIHFVIPFEQPPSDHNREWLLYSSRTLIVTLFQVDDLAGVSLLSRRLATIPRVANAVQGLNPVTKVMLQGTYTFDDRATHSRRNSSSLSEAQEVMGGTESSQTCSIWWIIALSTFCAFLLIRQQTQISRVHEDAEAPAAAQEHLALHQQPPFGDEIQQQFDESARHYPWQTYDHLNAEDEDSQQDEYSTNSESECASDEGTAGSSSRSSCTETDFYTVMDDNDDDRSDEESEYYNTTWNSPLGHPTSLTGEVNDVRFVSPIDGKREDASVLVEVRGAAEDMSAEESLLLDSSKSLLIESETIYNDSRSVMSDENDDGYSNKHSVEAPRVEVTQAPGESAICEEDLALINCNETQKGTSDVGNLAVDALALKRGDPAELEHNNECTGTDDQKQDGEHNSEEQPVGQGDENLQQLPSSKSATYKESNDSPATNSEKKTTEKDPEDSSCRPNGEMNGDEECILLQKSVTIPDTQLDSSTSRRRDSRQEHVEQGSSKVEDCQAEDRNVEQHNKVENDNVVSFRKISVIPLRKVEHNNWLVQPPSKKARLDSDAVGFDIEDTQVQNTAERMRGDGGSCSSNRDDANVRLPDATAEMQHEHGQMSEPAEPRVVSGTDTNTAAAAAAAGDNDLVDKDQPEDNDTTFSPSNVSFRTECEGKNKPTESEDYQSKSPELESNETNSQEDMAFKRTEQSSPSAASSIDTTTEGNKSLIDDRQLEGNNRTCTPAKVMLKAESESPVSEYSGSTSPEVESNVCIQNSSESQGAMVLEKTEQSSPSRIDTTTEGNNRKLGQPEGSKNTIFIPSTVMLDAGTEGNSRHPVSEDSGSKSPELKSNASIQKDDESLRAVVFKQSELPSPSFSPNIDTNTETKHTLNFFGEDQPKDSDTTIASSKALHEAGSEGKRRPQGSEPKYPKQESISCKQNEGESQGATAALMESDSAGFCDTGPPAQKDLEIPGTQTTRNILDDSKKASSSEVINDCSNLGFSVSLGESGKKTDDLCTNSTRPFDDDVIGSQKPRGGGSESTRPFSIDVSNRKVVDDRDLEDYNQHTKNPDKIRPSRTPEEPLNTPTRDVVVQSEILLQKQENDRESPDITPSPRRVGCEPALNQCGPIKQMRVSSNPFEPLTQAANGDSIGTQRRSEFSQKNQTIDSMCHSNESPTDFNDREGTENNSHIGRATLNPPVVDVSVNKSEMDPRPEILAEDVAEASQSTVGGNPTTLTLPSDEKNVTILDSNFQPSPCTNGEDEQPIDKFELDIGSESPDCQPTYLDLAGEGKDPEIPPEDSDTQCLVSVERKAETKKTNHGNLLSQGAAPAVSTKVPKSIDSSCDDEQLPEKVLSDPMQRSFFFSEGGDKRSHEQKHIRTSVESDTRNKEIHECSNELSTVTNTQPDIELLTNGVEAAETQNTVPVVRKLDTEFLESIDKCDEKRLLGQSASSPARGREKRDSKTCDIILRKDDVKGIEDSSFTLDNESLAGASYVSSLSSDPGYRSQDDIHNKDMSISKHVSPLIAPHSPALKNSGKRKVRGTTRSRDKENSTTDVNSIAKKPAHRRSKRILHAESSANVTRRKRRKSAPVLSDSRKKSSARKRICPSFNQEDSIFVPPSGDASTVGRGSGEEVLIVSVVPGHRPNPSVRPNPVPSPIPEKKRLRPPAYLRNSNILPDYQPSIGLRKASRKFEDPY